MKSRRTATLVSVLLSALGGCAEPSDFEVGRIDYQCTGNVCDVGLMARNNTATPLHVEIEVTLYQSGRESPDSASTKEVGRGILSGLVPAEDSFELRKVVQVTGEPDSSKLRLLSRLAPDAPSRSP